MLKAVSGRVRQTLEQAAALLRGVRVREGADEDTRAIAEVLDTIRAVLEGTTGARDEFASVVGHELRSALLPIKLLVDAMIFELERDRVPAPGELARRLQLFERELARADHDLRRLLDFSRIRSGRLDLELEDVDLSATVAAVVAAHRQEAALAQCTVTLDAPAPVVGRWDRLRVHQIATNILSNAIKYGGGAPIEVAVSATDDDGARLVVRDHGPGIPREGRDAIFARFERIDSQSQHSGYGVGLWVVARVVEALGGRIAVESEPGQGATFTVTLPKRRDAAVASRR